MNRMIMLLALLGLVSGYGPVQGDEPITQVPANQDPETRTAQVGRVNTYLGVVVEPVPAALHKQLPDILPEGQGLLVNQVIKDSPAARAGLEPYDVLKTYGDKTITSPEAFSGLIQADKPGEEVVISYVRGGKPLTCKATLGEREAAHDRALPPHIFRLGPDNIFRRSLGGSGTPDDGGLWETFDAIRFFRLKDDLWRAEIEYRTKDGKKQSHVFEGSRGQIVKDVKAMKDLPENEREHLLRTLDPAQPVFEFHFPPTNFLGPQQAR